MPQSVTVDNADLFTPEIRDLLATLGRPLDDKVTVTPETVSTPAGERELPVAVAVLLSLPADPPLRVQGEFHPGVMLGAQEFETSPMPQLGAWFAIGRAGEEHQWITDLDQPDWTDPVVYQIEAEERHKMPRGEPLSQRLAALALDVPIGEADRFPRACLLGDLPAVEAALAAGADPHQTEHGIPPLYLAASVGSVSVVSALLAAGADPNSVATADVDIPSAYLDLDRHVVRHPRISTGDSALQAAFQGRVSRRDVEPSTSEVVSALLAAGADPDYAGGFGSPAILAPFASRLPAREVLESVRLLLAAGTDPNSANGYRRETALHYVLIGSWDGDRPQGLKLLLQAGADPNARNNDGAGPLHYAFRSGKCLGESRSWSLRLLLDAGADPNLADTQSGHTALHYAFNGPFDTVDELLDGVRILLAAGTDPNLANDRGETVLHHAVSTSRITGDDLRKTVQTLVDAGANPNRVDIEGQTALHHVFRTFFTTVDRLLSSVRIMLAAGADPKLADEWGETALHHAVGHRELTDEGRREAVRLLLAAGADPDVGSASGYPVTMTEDPVCVKILLDAGAAPR